MKKFELVEVQHQLEKEKIKSQKGCLVTVLVLLLLVAVEVVTGYKVAFKDSLKPVDATLRTM